MKYKLPNDVLDLPIAMDFQRLRYFIEVARQRNFSRAANICHVSQPSLSQQIKKLESEIGGALFLRSHGMVSLSPLGESFLRYARAILAEVEVAEEFVNLSQQNLLRTISIGAIPTVAPYVIPNLFRTIRQKYPNIRLELKEFVTETLLESLLTGETTFAILSPPTKLDEECDSVDLFEDDFLLTLPETHPLSNETEITVNMLKDEQILLLETSHCLSAQTAKYCQQMGISADVSMVSSQIDTLLGMVEQGFGLTFVPRISSQAHGHRKVVFRQLKSIACSRLVRLVWLKRKFLSKTQESVIESVRCLKFSHD